MLSGESLANRQALFQVRPNAEFRYNLAASSISTAPPPGNKSLPFQQVALMRDRPRKTYMDFLFQWFGEVKIRSMIFSTSGKKNPQQLATKSWEFVMKKDAPMDAPTRPGRRFEENVSGYSKGILVRCWDLRFFEAKSDTPWKINILNFPKMEVWFRWFSFSSRWFFRFHVNFQGCNIPKKGIGII